MEKKRYGGFVTAAAVLAVLALAVLAVTRSSYDLSQNQRDTLRILLTVCACAVGCCFIAGELAQNFSQMDKLWSILPVAYTWIIAVRGGMKARLICFALIVTAWGVRLTMNFARKGAYRLKFWTGNEDYRWAVVRQNPIFRRGPAWTLFDLFFISGYQNLLVLAICLPCLACMESEAPLGVPDVLAALCAVGFLALETVADEEQWKFQETKKRLLADASELSELPDPYDLGFNTVGLWGRMRHPNYLGEQGIWLSLYFFAVAAGCGLFHWTLAGPLLLVLLFIGSSALGESISASKYPLYPSYAAQVRKYVPTHRFRRS